MFDVIDKRNSVAIDQIVATIKVLMDGVVVEVHHPDFADIQNGAARKNWFIIGYLRLVCLDQI